MNENCHLSTVKHRAFTQNQTQNRESTWFTEYVIICAILDVNIGFPHFFQIRNFTQTF